MHPYRNLQYQHGRYQYRHGFPHSVDTIRHIPESPRQPEGEKRTFDGISPGRNVKAHVFFFSSFLSQFIKCSVTVSSHNI